MANVFTDYATSQNTANTNGADRPTLSDYGGKVYHIDVRKTAYTAATADPLYLALLPKGARLLPDLCSVDHGDPGDACTGKIGYFTNDATPTAIDDDYFGASLALGNAAGRKTFSEAGTKGDAFLTPVTFTEDSWVVVTWTTVTSGASHTQCWHIAYTLG
jgi:hypothetical protein